MAFSGLASNQMVSEIEASTGGFLLKAGQSHGSSTKCMTKSDATIKYDLDATSIAGYSNNQLIPKNVWVWLDTTPPTVPTNLNGTSYQGYIDFFWDASTDASTVDGSFVIYEIYRDNVLYYTTTDTFFTDVTNDIIYRNYKVRARDESLNYSAFGNSISKKALDTCFVEGTLITLLDGTQVPIELLKLNQLILSVEIETLQDTNNISELYKWNSDKITENRIESPITKIFKQTADKTIIINNGLLEATPKHSQFIKRNGIWKFIAIGDVVAGDYLYNINGEEIEVTDVKINSELKNIYPLTLSLSHTYFANNILTHNVKIEEF